MDNKAINEKFEKTMFWQLCLNAMKQDGTLTRAGAIRAMAERYPDKLTEAVIAANE